MVSIAELPIRVIPKRPEIPFSQVKKAVTRIVVDGGIPVKLGQNEPLLARNQESYGTKVSGDFIDFRKNPSATGTVEVFYPWHILPPTWAIAIDLKRAAVEKWGEENVVFRDNPSIILAQTRKAEYGGIPYPYQGEEPYRFFVDMLLCYIASLSPEEMRTFAHKMPEASYGYGINLALLFTLMDLTVQGSVFEEIDRLVLADFNFRGERIHPLGYSLAQRVLDILQNRVPFISGQKRGKNAAEIIPLVGIRAA